MEEHDVNPMTEVLANIVWFAIALGGIIGVALLVEKVTAPWRYKRRRKWRERETRRVLDDYTRAVLLSRSMYGPHWAPAMQRLQSLAYSADEARRMLADVKADDLRV